MLDSGQQTVLDKYAEELHLLELRALDCKIYHDPGTVNTTRKTNDPRGDNLWNRVHGGKTKKMAELVTCYKGI